jgi:hypothetical protein
MNEAKTYIANTNQMTDGYEIIKAGSVIPDGALSDASIKGLLEMGLIREATDEEVQAANEQPKEG